MLLDDDAWDKFFGRFHKIAFRLEVQQTYTMPREQLDFQRFLAGEAMPDGYNSAWQEEVRGLVSSGRSLQRAKLIRRPYTSYTRYLMSWAVPGNVHAGEDYRIIDVADGELELPDQDFWMFDEKDVVHLNYRPDGTQINRELITEPDIAQYLTWRDRALAHSVPFSEWDFGA